MPMRLELGTLTVQVEHQEEATAFLRGLFRHLTNKEVAELLGVTDKTVRRWQQTGRLPSRSGGQLTLLDLLGHLFSAAPADPPRLAQAARAPRACPGSPSPRHRKAAARARNKSDVNR